MKGVYAQDKVWDPGEGIHLNVTSNPPSGAIAPGSTVMITATATDQDHWTQGGNQDTADDPNLSFTFANVGNSFGTFDANPNGNEAQWTAPYLPGDYTVSITVKNTPAANAGAKDPDKTVNLTFTVQDVWSVGDPLKVGLTSNPESTYDADNNPPRYVAYVDRGTAVQIHAVITDSDHWAIGDLSGDAPDNFFYCTWSAPPAAATGTLNINPQDDTQATWTAPQKPGDYYVIVTVFNISLDDPDDETHFSDPPVTQRLLIRVGYSNIEELRNLGFYHRVDPTNVVKGTYGANRTVYTNSNIGGVEGTFEAPREMYLGDKYVEDVVDPQTGHIGIGKNPNQNKPTFYLGAECNVFICDMGFQYEANFKDNQRPGWSLSCQLTVYPKRNNENGANKWYQPDFRTHLDPDDPVFMQLEVDADGDLHLTGTYPGGDLPPIVDRQNRTPNFYPDIVGAMSPATMKCRRNIGITQGVPFDADNSYMHHTNFKEGKIKVWNQNGSLAAQWNPWTTGDSVYKQEGYPAGHEHDGPEPEKGPKFYIDSVPPWHRKPNGDKRPDSPLPAGATQPRQVEEAVNVDLLKPSSQIDKKPKQTATTTPK